MVSLSLYHISTFNFIINWTMFCVILLSIIDWPHSNNMPTCGFDN